ncbi:MAG: adenylate/guanylate cyclase domain-containing protein [Saprospiraceae bacterium]|nr:adenylate/guanylate cyclase domain-containing protein [Saprospiraceae bacterium]
MPEERRLAAILFADIQAYSAMMHEDEQNAMEVLEHFRSVIDLGISKFNGEKIQDMGDGCLLIFSSAIQALDFAKWIQEYFRSSKYIPVRIGLHHGDILFLDGNVFGDCVNIASRIESIGIPGAVLFSKDIFNLIKNQPQIEASSIGFIEFKNIEDPVEIFALAHPGFPVPRKEDLRGKLKEKKQVDEPPKRKISLLTWTIPLAVFAAISIWILAPSPESDSVLKTWMGQWQQVRETENGGNRDGLLTFEFDAGQLTGLAKLYYGETTLTDTLFDIINSDDGTVIQGRWKSELRTNDGDFRFQLDSSSRIFTGFYRERESPRKYSWTGNK